MKKPASTSTAPQTWWQWVLVYPGLILGLLGSVPTVVEASRSWLHEVPFGTAAGAEQRARLFAKNTACLELIASTERSVHLPDATIVQALPCDTGDIMIRVEPPAADPIIHWVPREQLLKTVATGPSMAANATEVAQAGNRPVAVLCVVRQPRGMIVRRLRLADGTCIEEVINSYTGTVTRKPGTVACAC
ncbi:MAG: hypothetical protein JNK67_26880 [Alphaproteobacteria bacterium]|nr:hypothetical protein [Alphaproteobacteria bacterium]